MTSRHSPDARLNNLVKKKQQIDAQIAALDARLGSERRKIENRAVWVLGRLLRDNLTVDPETEKWVRSKLPARLTDRDRQMGVWQVLFPQDQGEKNESNT